MGSIVPASRQNRCRRRIRVRAPSSPRRPEAPGHRPGAPGGQRSRPGRTWRLPGATDIPHTAATEAPAAAGSKEGRAQRRPMLGGCRRRQHRHPRGPARDGPARDDPAPDDPARDDLAPRPAGGAPGVRAVRRYAPQRPKPPHRRSRATRQGEQPCRIRRSEPSTGPRPPQQTPPTVVPAPPPGSPARPQAAWRATHRRPPARYGGSPAPCARDRPLRDTTCTRPGADPNSTARSGEAPPRRSRPRDRPGIATGSSGDRPPLHRHHAPAGARRAPPRGGAGRRGPPDFRGAVRERLAQQRARPRWMRERTVPSFTPSVVEISSYERPSMSHSTTAARKSGGRVSSARWTSSSKCRSAYT
jgi:hypothetical protein